MSPVDPAENQLKKIAFIAMPFGTKSTGLPLGELPSKVDFDALWERAIKPALESLGYLSIRADEQTGSVIIKDMLAQLVFHADLVVADISLPNGNVYYEAGVRHATKETGCVLLNASWARPLFDLRQITYLSYPFHTDNPSESDYQAVFKTLTNGIPGLVDSAGPVFELAKPDAAVPSSSKFLKEQAESLFNFEVELKEAVIEVQSGVRGDRDKLRSLVSEEKLEGLPSYALKNLVAAVRDHLGWAELRNVINRLPSYCRNQGWFQENEALAEGKLGNISKAVALLEGVIERDGPTSERYGNIGSRYGEQARQHPKELDKSSLNRAIRAYETGLVLDLNDYYCAHKLLVTYVERDRLGDAERAGRCAIHVDLACDRAEKNNPDDEWLAPTRLILAVFRRDVAQAEKLLDNVLDRDWSNWKRIGLLTDLKSLFGLRVEAPLKANDDDETQQSLFEMIEEIEKQLPVPQASLQEKLLEWIKTEPTYEKVQEVEARIAIVNELVISITKDGEEGHNFAKEGDIVVRNMTAAKEMYIVAGDVFRERYSVKSEPGAEWQIFEPTGKARAIQITGEITSLLGVGNRFFIEAPWKESQFASEGDYFVAPAPGFDEIYRVGESEFKETYALKPGSHS